MKSFSYKKLWRFYPSYLELIPILAIVFTFAYALLQYPALPDSIAAGTAIDGSITAYMDKTLMQVLYSPISGLILYLVLTYFSYSRMSKLEGPDGELNMTKKMRKKLSPQFLESYRAFSVRMIFASIAGLVLATSLSSFIQIQASLGKAIAYIGILPWLFYIIAFVCAILQFIRTRSTRKTVQEAIGK
ncbi:hypothetical protein JR334_03145 [Clostridia bacterium]|nr:hypothetical protein JR334_03145 [Clostridia bacterium]